MPRISFAVALLLSMFSSLARAAEPLPPIPRIFPPIGTKPDEATSKKLRGLVEELERDLRPFDPRGKDDAGRKTLDETLFADVAIYPKAVRFALDYDEFYKPTDIADAEKLLTIGRARLKELQDGVKEPSWTKQRGLVVRGYISAIDESVQPYGLHIPEDLDLTKKPPLYVWLHGRQEKTLDLQFISERAKNKGKFAADDAITVHPFGRYNNAFKFAGERDVLDVMFLTEKLYKTDPTKRVLMGFSMGGAGCWHIGAHYPHLFCAMAPGAGFSESRRFLKIKDDALPPWYEQVLWQWYDVPNYTQNLFNLPVIAYSGEKDGQKQAADVMEAEFAKHCRKLNHIIGPGMGHDYDKGSLEKIRTELKAITSKPNEQRDQTVVVRFFPEYFYLFIDAGNGQRVYPADKSSALIDHPPIDAAFCEPFVFVMPTGKSKNPAIDAWVKRESAYQIDRWRRTMRGDVKVINDTDITTGHETSNVLILWGDRDSNQKIKQLLDSSQSWQIIAKHHLKENGIPVGIVKKEAPIGFTFDCSPLGGYMARTELQYVLNSGPTFRDEHDRNNANQTPKLPDWAVIDVTTPGDAKSPGRVVTAGFFDNDWKYVDPAKQQAEFEARQKKQQ